jgi:hypothetical protein
MNIAKCFIFFSSFYEIRILEWGNSYWQNASLRKSEGAEEWIAA